MKTKIIVYGNELGKEKILNLVKDTHIEAITLSPNLTEYQKQRSLIYGHPSFGHEPGYYHAVGVFIISGDDPLFLKVLSADINKKNIPIIIYIEDTDPARKIWEDMLRFLDKNHKVVKEQYKVDSFCFKTKAVHPFTFIVMKDEAKANYRVLHEKHSTQEDLLKAIYETYAIYAAQLPKDRTVRPESNPPSDAEVALKRNLFSKKGFSKMAGSLEDFQSHLDPHRPTFSFFGTTSPRPTEIDKWALEFGNCNLIYGLGGAEQSILYRFALFGRVGGCNIYGTIPFAQTDFEKDHDFSKLQISSCYITHQLQERMEAFEKGHCFIVLSPGTGTYEELFAILDRNRKSHVIIVNAEGCNCHLVRFLEEYKDKYPNIYPVTTQAEFRIVINSMKRAFSFENTRIKTSHIVSNHLTFPPFAEAPIWQKCGDFLKSRPYDIDSVIEHQVRYFSQDQIIHITQYQIPWKNEGGVDEGIEIFYYAPLRKKSALEEISQQLTEQNVSVSVDGRYFMIKLDSNNTEHMAIFLNKISPIANLYDELKEQIFDVLALDKTLMTQENQTLKLEFN